MNDFPRFSRQVVEVVTLYLG